MPRTTGRLDQQARGAPGRLGALGGLAGGLLLARARRRTATERTAAASRVRGAGGGGGRLDPCAAQHDVQLTHERAADGAGDLQVLFALEASNVGLGDRSELASGWSREARPGEITLECLDVMTAHPQLEHAGSQTLWARQGWC